MRRAAFASAIAVLLAAGPPLAWAAPAANQPPVPDARALLGEVQAHQRAMDQTRENYTYREEQSIQELGRDGKPKKTERREFQVFYVHAHAVRRLVAKDGVALDASAEAKENERVRKEIDKAEHTPPGQFADDKQQVSVGRLLAIEHFSNARRIEMDHRSVLAYDFEGDPDAHAHGAAESASKKLAGTLWIDEQDRQVRRVQATLRDTFRVGFGLFALDKGSNFTFDQKLVNGEIWLPTSAAVHVEAKAVAFLSYRANVQISFDRYQRFHTDAQQQPAAK